METVEAWREKMAGTLTDAGSQPVTRRLDRGASGAVSIRTARYGVPTAGMTRETATTLGNCIRRRRDREAHLRRRGETAGRAGRTEATSMTTRTKAATAETT